MRNDIIFLLSLKEVFSLQSRVNDIKYAFNISLSEVITRKKRKSSTKKIKLNRNIEHYSHL